LPWPSRQSILRTIGLLDKVPSADSDIPLLLKEALEKVAFLPFGLMIDQWRWKVFSGEVTPADYNKAWWDLRLKYQGVAPPVARSEADFDPGAKYHVPANVPYTRYFLAEMLPVPVLSRPVSDVGIHRTPEPLHVLRFERSGGKVQQDAGNGTEQALPDELEILTGQRQMDAGGMLNTSRRCKSGSTSRIKDKRVRLVKSPRPRTPRPGRFAELRRFAPTGRARRPSSIATIPPGVPAPPAEVFFGSPFGIVVAVVKTTAGRGSVRAERSSTCQRSFFPP